MRYTTMVENLDWCPPNLLTVSEQEVDEANMLFTSAFSFYGGYAQMTANAKDEACEAMAYK